MISFLTRYLQKSDFIKNFITLVGGNFFSQIISIAAIPIISRIYTPAQFGLFALFCAILNSMSNVGCLSYERAILLPKSEKDVFNVMLLSVFVLIAVCFILLIIVFFFNYELTVVFNNKNIGTWLYIVPVGVFINGLNSVVGLLRLRNKNFKLISVSKISRTVSSVSIKIGFGIIVLAHGGCLVLGEIVGGISCFLTLIKRPSPEKFKEFLNKTSMAGIKRVAFEYKKFPIYSSWGTFLNFSTQNSVVFVLSFIFTPAVVGYYGLCNRALRQPLMLISGAMQNVYFQKSALQVNNGQCIFPYLGKLVFNLSLLALIPTIVLMVFGQYIFVFLFGKNWVVAGQYVQVMAPWFFFLFIASPAKIIFEVCQKQELRLIVNIVIAISRISSLFIGYIILRDALRVIAFFIAVNSFLEFIVILMAFSIAKKNDKNLMRDCN